MPTATLRDDLDDILAALPPNERKALLNHLVKTHWGPLPPYSTLDAPVIEEVQKASAGGGVAPVFFEDGRWKVLLAQAGPHYKKAIDTELYMIPGGFIDLTKTKGSSRVPASIQPESPRIATARETEEEFQNENGPLFSIAPERLKPADTNTLRLPWGETRIVLGMMLQLAAAEVTTAKQHITRLGVDAAYNAAVAKRTINDESGKPEVIGAKIFDLQDVAEGRVPLLHPDQLSLFELLHAQLNPPAEILSFRHGPTRSFRNKVKSLPTLHAQVEEWRQNEHAAIGITSGAFDLTHPGHMSFLEDAARACDRLIVVIASDRTVREQKGEEKPYINELKRAQMIAGFEMVDAVIISDEPYHETILKTLRPDILFKGDDYAGQQVMGADLVGRVALIPCAEKEFYSSSQFVQKIKTGEPDIRPNWPALNIG